MAQKRRKKGKRLRLRLGPSLWLLLLVNVAAGVVYSPVTSLRKVRVVGAIEQDVTRVQAELATLQGIPFVQIGPRDVETRLAHYPDVADASFTRNLFGSAVVKVVYKTPVAVLESDPEIYLSDRGELYPARVAPEGLPKLKLQSEATVPTLAYATTWEGHRVALICKRISGILQAQSVVIEVSSGGVVCLNVEDKGQVILGDTSNVDEKLAVLKTMLDRQPNLLSDFQYINVTSPSRPAVGHARGAMP